MPKGVPGRTVCTVEDCPTIVQKWGLCSKHAYRMDRYGSTDKPPYTPRPNARRKPSPIIDGKKLCAHCKQMLDVAAFGYRTQMVTRLASWCLECERETGAIARASDRARQAAYQRKYRYGLTQAEYDQLLESQDGRCAICGSDSDRFHVDHDHDTGEVRGVLCRPCNQGLGMFKDNPERLANAIAYLHRRLPWPAH